MSNKYKNDNHSDALIAKERIVNAIDGISMEQIIRTVKKAPSFRGALLGNMAEDIFVDNVLLPITGISNIIKHDDQDPDLGKIDREFIYGGKKYTLQVKSISTNSISFDEKINKLTGSIRSGVGNARDVNLPTGKKIRTSSYLVEDFQLLVVPIFPFTGNLNDYAYKKSKNCKRSKLVKGCTAEEKDHILSISQPIEYPLSSDWVTDFQVLLNDPELGTVIPSSSQIPESVE